MHHFEDGEEEKHTHRDEERERSEPLVFEIFLIGSKLYHWCCVVWIRWSIWICQTFKLNSIHCIAGIFGMASDTLDFGLYAFSLLNFVFEELKGTFHFQIIILVLLVVVILEKFLMQCTSNMCAN